MKKIEFPKNFLWGSATSAHQVEGNNIYNDWYVWENQGQVKNKQVSGMACDHYNLFRQDIDLLVDLNQNAYRFSIEWSRIEPEKGKINRHEIEHYRQVLQYLKKKKVKSFVTLHHFTNPIWLDWENANSANDFRNYAELLAKEFGDLVDFWITINEPNILAKHGWLRGNFPPGKKNMKSMFNVLDNLVNAHNLAYEQIHKIIPEALVGVAKNNTFYELAKPNELGYLALELNQKVRNEYFLKKVKLDFVGLNYYSRKKMIFDASSADDFYASKVKTELPLSDMGWEICPDYIFSVLHELATIVGLQIPIYITENGIADAKDKYRKKFIQDHLASIHKAIKIGIDVRGYLYWSLLDNFEWGFGYGPRFGLIEVNYNTQERKVRKSAKYYAQICKTGKL